MSRVATARTFWPSSRTPHHCHLHSVLCLRTQASPHPSHPLPSHVTPAPPSTASAMSDAEEVRAYDTLRQLAAAHQLDVTGGDAAVRRTSSRFCLAVEHGDYNGTSLFGVGTDRFIWIAFKANDSGKVRIASHNFKSEGVVEFEVGKVPPPLTPEDSDNYVLRKHGYKLTRGMDAVVYGNIPGGGMSRSASLTINLLLTFFQVNGIEEKDHMKIIDLAQAVENVYIGSPCGNLDQIMIYFAKAGQGTHYDPATRSVTYVPLGGRSEDLTIISLDTGTKRPGLEKSTYKLRRAECDALAARMKQELNLPTLGHVKDQATLDSVLARFEVEMPGPCERLRYIYGAQQRFDVLLDAWRSGDLATVGRVFREDGHGLRDVYKISGPELETMCDIARTVPGVLGERMLGGGDKGASGALGTPDCVDALRRAVDLAYPRAHPEFANDYAVHVCKIVDGVQLQPGLTA